MTKSVYKPISRRVPFKIKYLYLGDYLHFDVTAKRIDQSHGDSEKLEIFLIGLWHTQKHKSRVSTKRSFTPHGMSHSCGMYGYMSIVIK